MAVVIDIDPTTGEERHTVGGVMALSKIFNDYAAGKAVAQSLFVGYAQPGNQHVVTIRGRLLPDGGAFDVQSSPQAANVPLGTVVVRMADQILKGTGST